MSHEQEKIVAQLEHDEELIYEGDKGWLLDLGKWEPPAGMQAGDWVEVTIRRYGFQP